MTINANYASTNSYPTPISWASSKAETSQQANQATPNTYLTPENSSTTSFMSEFGFRVNEQGIFDKDFNKAANIPESYEINIKSVQSIAKELSRQDGELSKLEIPEVINKYFSTLRSVEGEFATSSNSPLSRNEITTLNQGFSTQSGEFEGIINRIYADYAQLDKARTDNRILNPLGLDNKIIDFNFKSTITNTADNDVIKPYLNKNGEVSKSGLLMNFIYEDIKGANSTNESAMSLIYEDIKASTNTNVLFFDAPSLNFTDHQRFYEMLDNEGTLKNFINAQVSGGMSFDLYLHTQGINKQSVSDERLLVAYQQYKNSVKNANIEQFAKSSSIFQLYTQILLGQFNSIQSDYSTQSKSEVLSLANEMRSKSVDNFAVARQKQASRETIIKSYRSIMES